MEDARVWQNAGRERPLSLGEVVDLPDLVAEELVATGAAVVVDDDEPADDLDGDSDPANAGRGRKRAGKRDPAVD